MRYLKYVTSLVVALLAFSFVSAQEAGILLLKGTFAEPSLKLSARISPSS